MPFVLRGYMSDVQWNAFCDELDEALKPLNRVKRVQSFMTMLFFLFLICGIIFSIADFDTKKFKVYYLWWALAGVSIVSAIVVPHFFSMNTDEIVQVCDQQSEMNPMIRFHVRNEGELQNEGIEVQVSEVNDQLPTAPVASVWAEPEMVLPTAPVKETSIHGRLEELQRLKPHLTDSEYQRKRQEILDCV